MVTVLSKCRLSYCAFVCQKAKRREEEAPAIFQLKYNFFLVLMFLHPFPAKKPRFSWKTSKNSSCTMQCSSLTKLKISPVLTTFCWKRLLIIGWIRAAPLEQISYRFLPLRPLRFIISALYNCRNSS